VEERLETRAEVVQRQVQGCKCGRVVDYFGKYLGRFGSVSLIFQAESLAAALVVNKLSKAEQLELNVFLQLQIFLTRNEKFYIFLWEKGFVAFQILVRTSAIPRVADNGRLEAD